MNTYVASPQANGGRPGAFGEGSGGDPIRAESLAGCGLAAMTPVEDVETSALNIFGAEGEAHGDNAQRVEVVPQRRAVKVLALVPRCRGHGAGAGHQLTPGSAQPVEGDATP